MLRDSTHLERMINGAVGATFTDYLTSALADVDEKKNHGMCLLLRDVAADVVKGDRIQVIIRRLAERVVTKDAVH